MPRLRGRRRRQASSGWTRLAVTFRLLMLLRGLLLAMALVLASRERLDMGLATAVAVFSLETALACLAWRVVLPVVRSHPLLCCADAVLVFAVLAEGGVFGPFFLFAVMTAAIAGVLYAWGPVLMVCTAQIILCYVAMATASPLERGQPGLLIALPAFYPLAACAGVALRVLFDQYAEMEEGRRIAETEVAAAEERARLAREMHDSLAKTLQGIMLLVATLPTWIRRSPDRAEHNAREILAALQIASREARGLIADLREEAYGLPLPAAVRTVAAEWSGTHDVPVRVTTDGVPEEDVPIAVRYEVVSVLKEALTNVERHARANVVEIQLSENREGLVLSVRDDGVGFTPPAEGRLDHLAREGHYGLVGMAERARRVGGRFEVHSAPGLGAVLTITVPYWPEPAEHTPRALGNTA